MKPIANKFPVAMFLLLSTACAPMGKRFNPYSRVGTDKKIAKEAAFQPVALNNPLPAGLLIPSRELFRLGVGDLLEIEQLGVPNTRQDCRIMPDGLIYYHTCPGMKCTGLTLPELKTQLEASLKDYYRSPQISIILRNVTSQRVWVLGRVNTPGLYPIAGPTSVLEAIARAGGLFTSRFSGTTEELADLQHSFVVRNGEFLPVDFVKLLRQGDLSQNVYLKNGDYVYLPSALTNEVYVLGAVRTPKAVGFMDQVTLVSAIADAKGLLSNAYAQRAVIVRGSLVKPTVATVNLTRILTGKDPDIALQPRDIVWIPNSPWDRVESYTKVILNSYVRTVSANKGTQAVSSTAGSVQPIIPIGTAQ